MADWGLGVTRPATLLRLRPSLRDHVVIVLKKAMFSREQGARFVAAGGVVLLVPAPTLNQRPPPASAQASTSTASAT